MTDLWLLRRVALCYLGLVAVRKLHFLFGSFFLRLWKKVLSAPQCCGMLVAMDAQEATELCLSCEEQEQVAEPMAAVTKPKKEPTAAAVAFLTAYYNVFFSSY